MERTTGVHHRFRENGHARSCVTRQLLDPPAVTIGNHADQRSSTWRAQVMLRRPRRRAILQQNRTSVGSRQRLPGGKRFTAI